MDLTTLSELRNMPIAHTPEGDFVFYEGIPTHEFLVKGRIKRIRAGLFFIDIEDESYSTPKRDGFKIDEYVTCIVRPDIKEDGPITFVIRSVEKSD